MTISRNLKLTLLLMIGLALCGGLVSLWVRDRIAAETYTHLERRLAVQQQLERIKTGVLTALSAQHTFLLRYPFEALEKTRSYVDAAHSAVRETRQALKAIVHINNEAGMPPSNPHREMLEGQLSLFEVELKRVVLLVTREGDPQAGLLAQMVREVDELVIFLDRLQRGNGRVKVSTSKRRAVQSLRNDLMFVRGWEKDYLLRGNLGFLVRARDRVEAMRSELEHSPLTAAEQERVLDSLAIYLESFERLALNNVQLFTELDRIDTIALALQDLTGRYGDAEEALLVRSEADADKRARRNYLSLIGFVALLLAITAGLAVRITRRIVRRMHTLVGAARMVGETGDCPPVHIRTRDEFADLATEFNRMVEQLRAARAQLIQSEKLAAMGKLSASIAHEINNPLFGIQGCLERIVKRLPEGDTDYRLVKLALGESQRIARLVQGLRDYHLPSDQTMTAIDLISVLDDVLLINQKYLQQAGARLVRNLPDSLPVVAGTRDQIQMVFVNLLTNAAEAMEGEGTVTVSAEVGEKTVSILFTDTGKGIDAAHLSQIFEPFFSTKNAVKGVGLGLSISYGIIQRHGGDIRVESRPGHTEFHVTLPLLGSQPAPTRPPLVLGEVDLNSTSSDATSSTSESSADNSPADDPISSDNPPPDSTR